MSTRYVWEKSDTAEKEVYISDESDPKSTTMWLPIDSDALKESALNKTYYRAKSVTVDSATQLTLVDPELMDGADFNGDVEYYVAKKTSLNPAASAGEIFKAPRAIFQTGYTTEYDRDWWYARLYLYKWRSVAITTDAQTVRGDVVGSVSSALAATYPADGISGSYWYTYRGEDSIDPLAVGYSGEARGGKAITILVTPRTNTYGGTITYRYEVSLDGGSTWTLVSTTIGKSVSYIIPKGSTQIVARVKASDSYGFTSADYITGASLAVTNNTAPSAPAAITVPAYVRGGSSLAISWDASEDVDGNVDGYKLERSYNGGSWTQIYQGDAASCTDKITYGWATVQYRVKAYDDDGDESSYTTSEVRTVANTVPPSAPGSITVPVAPVAGAQITVTWTAATDDDGDLVGYRLERQLDDGDWMVVYTGTALYYTDVFDKGYGTVTYRVSAYDSEAQYSGYVTSPARAVVNNNAPVITCELSGDLGTKSEGFTVPYSVSDADADVVTVTEQVDGRVRRTYEAALGEPQTFNITDDDGDRYWTRLLNGAHIIKIAADDGTNSTVYSLTFTKAVFGLSVTLTEPLDAEEAITVAVLSLLGSIPDDAEISLEITNNALDAVPVWQDVLADVLAGRNIVFANTVQQSGPAFNFRLTIERGESGVGGYLTSVQGGYQ